MRLTTRQVARLFLHCQGLSESPRRAAGTSEVARIVRNLGFVQVDSINVFERAHHLILGARLDGYRPKFLRKLLSERDLFEHWTHDASLIPIEYFPYWRHRFDGFEERMKNRKWWQERAGSEAERFQNLVHHKIEQMGPLPTRAFRQPEHQRGQWWGWTPARAALENLWRTGHIMISSRERFEKVYDLTHRVIPRQWVEKRVSRKDMVDWSCRRAIEGLGVASATEVAHYWMHVTSAEARAWCEKQLVSVQVDGVSQFALPDWEKRVRDCPEPPGRIRLLAPFDPLVRNRDRAQRLFNFDYRFEAYVPASKRVYGYYVTPLLEGDRLVGRLNPKFHRKTGVLEIDGLWWEPGVRATRGRTKRLEAELQRVCRRIGATDYRIR